MSKSINNLAYADRISHYNKRFTIIEKLGQSFETHDAANDGLKYEALEAVFTFGQDIRMEPDILEAFVRRHKLPWNKVTKQNPYNALIHLALPKSTKKPWLSQCSTVLDYAHDRKPNEPLREWLKEVGINERYKEAVEHFARSKTGKAGRSKALRLAEAKKNLISAPLTNALSGVDLSSSIPGFFRSLVYFDGITTRLVHVRDTPDDAATESYLLSLVSPDDISTHPLQDKPLFRFFRAIDLIVGSCGTANASGKQNILIGNKVVDGKAVTHLQLLSDSYTFTNASIILVDRIAELEGKGPLLFSYSDAISFRLNFDFNEEWCFEDDGSAICLANNAKSPLTLPLTPLSNYQARHDLRMGANPTRRHKHFQCTIEQMQSLLKALKSTDRLFKQQTNNSLTAHPKPKRFELVPQGNELCLELREVPHIAMSFLTFKKLGAAFHQYRSLAISDMVQLCNTLTAYGNDVTGFFADADVEDAALCIDHTFTDGDRFEYATPLVVSLNMDRTLICEGFAIEDEKLKQQSDTLHSSNNAAQARKHNYAKIKNDRLKNTAFPNAPYSCAGMFGAFITSYLPDDPHHRAERKFDFEWQLEWWRRMTDIPVHVIASNWNDEEVSQSDELKNVTKRGGRIIREPSQGITLNRNRCLTEFYASDFDWGIIMDDDAAIMHSPKHNSGAAFFSEMAVNPHAYDPIDVFYPISGKMPSQKIIWQEQPELFQNNHVFDPEYDLKGSLFVVRNFRKAGRTEIVTPPDFSLHGEDTLFAIEAISQKASVYRCNNIVLQEFSIGASHFPERKKNMQIGNQQITKMYSHLGLKMSTHKRSEHLLDRSEMLKQLDFSEATRIVIEKPKG